MKDPEASSHHFQPWMEMPEKNHRVAFQQAMKEANKRLDGRFHFDQHPDWDDLLAFHKGIMRSCLEETENPEAAIRKFHKSRLRFLDHRQDAMPMSAGSMRISNNQDRVIMRTYGEAQGYFPNDEAQQREYLRYAYENFTPKMKAAWDAHHAQVISIDRPLDADSDLTVGDTISNPMYPTNDGEALTFLDQLLDEGGFSDRAKLLGSIYLGRIDETETNREVMKRYIELTGTNISLGTVNNELKEIKDHLKKRGILNRRLKDENGTTN